MMGGLMMTKTQNKMIRMQDEGLITDYHCLEYDRSPRTEQEMYDTGLPRALIAHLFASVCFAVVMMRYKRHGISIRQEPAEAEVVQ